MKTSLKIAQEELSLAEAMYNEAHTAVVVAQGLGGPIQRKEAEWDFQAATELRDECGEIVYLMATIGPTIECPNDDDSDPGDARK